MACMKLFVATKAFLLQEGKILILRESSEYADRGDEGRWDVPGGRIDPAEPYLEALEREVREESGLSFTNPQIFSVQETFPTIHGEVCHIVRLYFAAHACSKEVTLSSDHDAYLWIDPRDHNAHHIMDDLHSVCATFVEKFGP